MCPLGRVSNIITLSYCFRNVQSNFASMSSTRTMDDERGTTTGNGAAPIIIVTVADNNM